MPRHKSLYESVGRLPGGLLISGPSSNTLLSATDTCAGGHEHQLSTHPWTGVVTCLNLWSGPSEDSLCFPEPPVPHLSVSGASPCVPISGIGIMEELREWQTLRNARDCLHPPLPPQHYTSSLAFSQYFKPRHKLSLLLLTAYCKCCACACECTSPACLYPCQSLSFSRLELQREWNVLDQPLPLAGTTLGYLLPLPLHPLPPPPPSVQSMNWKPRKNDSILCLTFASAGKCVDPHSFLQYPFGAFLNVSPKEPSWGSAKSASQGWLWFKA